MDVTLRRGFLETPEEHKGIDSIRIQCENSEFMIFYDKETDGISVKHVLKPIVISPQNISSVIVTEKNRSNRH